MNAEDEAKFSVICKTYGIGAAAAQALRDLIDESTSDAYTRGCDAQSYADTMHQYEKLRLTPVPHRSKGKRMPSIRQLKKNHRIEFVDDERKSGNGLIVTLRQGFTFETGVDNRVRGYDSINQATRNIPNEVFPHTGPFDP